MIVYFMCPRTILRGTNVKMIRVVLRPIVAVAASIHFTMAEENHHHRNGQELNPQVDSRNGVLIAMCEINNLRPRSRTPSKPRGHFINSVLCNRGRHELCPPARTVTTKNYMIITLGKILWMVQTWQVVITRL